MLFLSFVKRKIFIYLRRVKRMKVSNNNKKDEELLIQKPRFACSKSFAVSGKVLQPYSENKLELKSNLGEI